MRPADENQSHGKRPSLFASCTRPQAQDEQILARMERGGPRAGAAGGVSAPRRGRTALLGLGLLTVAGLVSTLAILARQGGPAIKPAPEMPVSVQAPLQAAPAAASGPALLVEQIQATQPAPLFVPALTRTIAPSIGPSIRPSIKSTIAPAPTLAARQAPKHVFKLASAKPAAVKPAFRPRPAAAPADPVVDSDIAILAAVLAQSPRHAHPADAPAELACQGKDCRNKAR